MLVTTPYNTGLIGGLTLVADDDALIASWFDNDRFFGYGVSDPAKPLAPAASHPVLDAARAWLDAYFSGARPDPRALPLSPRGTDFQRRVWRMLVDIPYGQTRTYGELAHRFEAEFGRRMSAQAIGGAVGRNPLCVIVPCHRVMGAKGNLTGFGGGIATKIALLEHEQANTKGFFVPKTGTAL